MSVKTSAPGAAPKAETPTDEQKPKDGTEPPAEETTGKAATPADDSGEEETETPEKKKQDGAEEEGEPAARAATPAEIRKAAAAAERARIAAIRALGKPGEEAAIQACIDDPECSPADAALRLRQAEAGVSKGRLAALAADDAGQHPSGAAGRPTESTPREAARAAVARYRELTTPKPRSRA